jgi:hypothetical protein
MLASSGKYRETAASSSIFLSSMTVIAATLVTGLVIDAIQKIAVRPHRNCSAAILKAYCLQVRELNIPGERHHSARQITGFNVFKGSDPCQSFGRKA